MFDLHNPQRRFGIGSVFISAVREGGSLKEGLTGQHAVQMLFFLLFLLVGFESEDAASKSQSYT